jgi:hypothetical protein
VEVKPSEYADSSTKEELKKELQSYQANKPWREALPLPQEKKGDDKKGDKKTDEKKAYVGEKKDQVAEKKDPQK